MVFGFGCGRPSLEPYKDYFLKPSVEEPKENDLTATFLGISTILISDGETSIMADGFFTRPGITTLLFGKIKPDEELISDVLKKANVTDLSAVIPVHSHHDHAMDAPQVALKTGALLVGSESTANIGRGWIAQDGSRLPENKIRVITAGTPLSFGKFTVTLIRSKHGPLPPFLAKHTGIGEKITDPEFSFPASLSEFKEGESYSVLIEHLLGNVLIQASAGFETGALIKKRADVVFLGIAGLGKQDDKYQKEYFQEIVTAVGATRIIPIHWDDFTRSIDKPLRPMIRLLDRGDFNKGMSFLINEVEADRKLSFHMLRSYEKIVLFPSR